MSERFHYNNSQRATPTFCGTNCDCCFKFLRNVFSRNRNNDINNCNIVNNSNNEMVQMHNLTTTNQPIADL